MAQAAGFGVPVNQLAYLREKVSRIIGRRGGHRYFFGVNSINSSGNGSIWYILYRTYRATGSNTPENIALTGVFIGEFFILSMLAGRNIVQFSIVIFFVMTAFIGINYNVSSVVFRGSSDSREQGWLMAGTAIVCASISLLMGILFLGGYMNALV